MAQFNPPRVASDRHMSAVEFRRIQFAPESVPPGQGVPRHRHFEAYATIVIEGAYEQSAYAGRMRVSAGDVLIQPTLDCHANAMLSRGIRLQRLPWPRESGLGGVYRIGNIDAILKAATSEILVASAMLVATIRRASPLVPRIERIGDLLAADIAGDPDLPIGEWAECIGVARESATRSFSHAFGVSPARFGAELKARSAWLRAIASRERLCEVAAGAGFCDQAHMTRAVKRLTGDTPASWRRSFGRSVMANAAFASEG